ncbi:MAG: cation:proton antiporter [Planctomycetota bacterium]
MDPTSLVAVALCVFAFGLLSHRIESTPLTAPMLFVAAGFVAGPGGLDVLSLEGGAAEVVIELTLVLVLFSDASRIRVRELRRGYALPARLLLVGLPLTIALGAVLGRVLFPALSWPELALLAAVLAPTDAALGQVVVSSPRVPVRIRQALNVESGLNDGIAVPVVTVFLAAAAAGATGGVHDGGGGLGFAAAQIGLGPVAGLLVAGPAGWLVQRAAAARSINRTFENLAGLSIALGAFGTAELIGGNGFIAAFTAGLVIGNTTSSVCARLQEFAEDEGQLLALIAFLAFGATLLPQALEALGWRAGLYIALSLTAARMVPVALALVGSGLRAPSVAFLGWFGPRGLATILFALLVAEAEAIPNHELLVQLVTLTVAVSTLAHGVTAAPLASAYGRWAERLRARAPERPECGEAPDLPVRVRLRAQRSGGRQVA